MTTFGLEGTHYTIGEDGTPQYTQEVIDAVRASGKSFDELYGLNRSTALRVDASADMQFSAPEYIALYAEWRAMPSIDIKHPWPNWQADDGNRLADLQTRCSTIFNNELTAFVTGQRNLSEWAQVRQQLIDAGSEEIEEIYNKYNYFK